MYPEIKGRWLNVFFFDFRGGELKFYFFFDLSLDEIRGQELDQPKVNFVLTHCAKFVFSSCVRSSLFRFPKRVL